MDVFPFSSLHRKALSMKRREEEAGVRLLMVVGNEYSQGVLDEVERRRALFAAHWPTTPYSHDVTPMHAALESVYQDVVKGWL